MSDIAAAPEKSGVLGRVAALLKALVLGSLAAGSAPTSLILLGWLQRRMRAVALVAANQPSEHPGWVMGASGSKGLIRLLGGLGANIRDGLSAVLSLGLAAIPFTGIWILSWWAGWENSFSKGYEQAFVGPLLAFSGIGLFMVLMIFIPLGLAHQAIERRWLALFELRRIRALYRETGWAYVALAAATVVFALPIFAGRGLVAFGDQTFPGLSDMSLEEVSQMMGLVTLIKAAYVVAALIILRGWLARIYAKAAMRAAYRDPELWEGSTLSGATVETRPRWRGPRWLRTIAIMVIWFGLAAQIFVGQFLNHAWWVWLTHPFFLLPMAM